MRGCVHKSPAFLEKASAISFIRGYTRDDRRINGER